MTSSYGDVGELDLTGKNLGNFYLYLLQLYFHFTTGKMLQAGVRSFVFYGADAWVEGSGLSTA